MSETDRRPAPSDQPASPGPEPVADILGGRSRQAAGISVMRQAALVPVIILLIIVGSFVNSAFFTVSNMTGIGEQVSSLGVVVVGESLILLIGGMDLSLEGTYGLAPMVAAWLIVRFVPSPGDATQSWVDVAAAGMRVNVVLAILNLLPLLPLDGGRVVTSLLPNRLAYQYSRLEPYGMTLLIVLMFTGVLGKVLMPLVSVSLALVYTMFGFQ